MSKEPSGREANPSIPSREATDRDAVWRKPVSPSDDLVDIVPHLQPVNAAWATLEANHALSRGINLGLKAGKGLPGAQSDVDAARRVAEAENAEARALIFGRAKT